MPNRGKPSSSSRRFAAYWWMPLGLGDRLRGERGDRRVLRQYRRTDGEVAGQAVHRAPQLLWHQQPTEPPACHAEILRESIGDHGIPRGFPGATGLRGAWVDQAVVDLVTDQPHPRLRAPGCNRGQLRRRDDGPGRVRRARHYDAVHQGLEIREHLRGRPNRVSGPHSTSTTWQPRADRILR